MQVSSALQFLHGQRPSAIVHTDVKCRNILLAGLDRQVQYPNPLPPKPPPKVTNCVLLTNPDSCKLADFGLARVWNHTATPASRARGIVAGSGRYIAPEVLRGNAISPAADMWSFGVTLWEMSLRRRFPSRDAMVPRVSSRLHVPTWRRTLDKYAHHVTNPPPALCDVIASCLRIDPRARATSEGVFYEFLFLADDVSTGVGGGTGPPLSSINEGELGDDDGVGGEFEAEEKELAELTESLSGANNLLAQQELNHLPS